MARSPSSLTAASSAFAFKAQSITLAPASSNGVGIPLPRPDAAPVATVPLLFNIPMIYSPEMEGGNEIHPTHREWRLIELRGLTVSDSRVRLHRHSVSCPRDAGGLPGRVQPEAWQPGSRRAAP